VVMLTNAAGDEVESYRYEVWGGFEGTQGGTASSGDPISRFLFTGREWDPELGIYHYRARAYSPELGRFLQQDPIDFVGGDVNLFRYCGNDPVNWVDPKGTIVWKPIIIAAWAYNTYKVYKGAKNLKKLQEHVDKANAAGKELERLRKLCPKGKKAQDDLKEQIKELEKDIRGHQKEINQKWPGAQSQ